MGIQTSTTTSGKASVWQSPLQLLALRLPWILFGLCGDIRKKAWAAVTGNLNTDWGRSRPMDECSNAVKAAWTLLGLCPFRDG
jgi:hypothetical protein